MRGGQAAFIAFLSWIATGNEFVVAWLAATLMFGALDSRLSRWFLGAARTRRTTTLVAAGHALSAASFVAVAVLLSRPPTPVHLAEAVLVLCAACLNNAMMSAGSRLHAAVLVGPAAALLIAGPFLTPLAGYPLSASDMLLMACAGGGFTVFIVRMAGAFHAKGEVLKVALNALAEQSAAAVAISQDAQQSRQRWRMIFDHSPMARVCFDASALYEALGAHGALAGARLGDALKAKLGSMTDLAAYRTLLEANRAATELCGDNLNATHFTEASLDAFCAALNNISDDGALPVFPAGLILANGDTLEVEVHLRLAPDGGKPWSLCLATYVDVTHSRRAAREQQEALEAAEIANRAKSEFLAVISHEIRTPLNGVLGMAQAMALNPLSRIQRQRLQVISESGSALRSIVDDLLDLSKIEASGLEIHCTDFELGPLVEGVYAAYAAEAQAKRLAFVLDIDPAVAGVYRADAGRIRQLLGNLISNALKFTHEGEVSVRVSRLATGARFEVRDTGIGIPPDRIPGLFGAFVQGDSSMTRRYGGAGLGLAICRQIILAMDGEVSVSSTVGQGSAFVVDLGLPPGPISASNTSEELAAAVRGPARVLAAEDNPVNQMVLKALLSQIGVEPTIVENGVDAVQAWEDANWDVILMDVQMPGMDGITATRRIRAREAELGRTPTPIIAVTANAMLHQVAGYRAAGVTEEDSTPRTVSARVSTMIAALTAPEIQLPAVAAG